MRTKHLFFTILLFVIGNLTFAQDNTVTIESAIADRFSTLLEALMLDGKLSESEARIYIEAVFDYDEAVIKHINTISVQPFIDKIKTGTFNVDEINRNLIEAVPETYRQQLLKNPNYLGWQIGREMNNGRISAQSISAVTNMILDGIKNNQRNKAIIQKLQAITPTRAILAEKSAATPKLTVVNDKSNLKNWKINPEKTKPNASNNNTTYNKVVIDNGMVVFESSVMGYADQFQNTYRNIEKFDFSKDFRITIKGQLHPFTYKKVAYNTSYFSIKLGDMYKIDVCATYTAVYEDVTDVSSISIKLPAAEFLPEYGKFTYEDVLFFTKKPNVSTFINKMNKAYKKVAATENPNFNYSNGFEFVIENHGGVLTFLTNGIDLGLKQAMGYLPNKYSFDIKGDTDMITKIESMKLEHL